MKTLNDYYYVYRISFPTGHFYYGYRKTKNHLIDQYTGSPVTHKQYWIDYMPCKKILKYFDNYEEAYNYEVKHIKRTWRNKYSLNDNCAGKVSQEAAIRGAVNRNKKYGCSFNNLSPEQRKINSMKGSQAIREKYAKKWLIVFPDGKQQLYIGLREAVEGSGLASSTISCIAKDGRVSKGGYRVKIID